MQDPKPGFKTTEFWMTILVIPIITLLSVLGYLSADQSGAITDSTAQVITAILHLLEVAAPIIGVVAYTWSRTKVKSK